MSSSFPSTAANDQASPPPSWFRTASAEASGVRRRLPNAPRPPGEDDDDDADDEETTEADREPTSGPLMLPPRPSWIPAPVSIPVARTPRSLQEDVITLVDRGPRRALAANVAADVSSDDEELSLHPMLWTAVCAATFLATLSLGLVLMRH